MQVPPPVPEPDEPTQPEWLPVISGYALPGPLIDTPIDCAVDAMYRWPDGRIVLIQAKSSVRPRVSPGDRWIKAIEEWSEARRGDRLNRRTTVPANSLDQDAAQDATALASAMMFSLAVMQDSSLESVVGAAQHLEESLGINWGETGESQRATLDTQYIATWLSPVESRMWRLQAEPVGVTHTRQVSGELVEQQLSCLLSHWHEVANSGLPQYPGTLLQRASRLNRLRNQEALCAVATAQQASTAALETRAAILTQPWESSKEAVASFAKDWLNLRPTPGLVEATSSALLFASLDDLDPNDMPLDTDELRKDAIRYHRVSRPIGETQLCGMRVDYLQRQIPGAQLSADGCTVGDGLIDLRNTEDQALASTSGWHDPRIAQVLHKLKPDELRVALTYALGGTWAEAARRCALPAKFGERVRRKLSRLGDQLSDLMGDAAA